MESLCHDPCSLMVSEQACFTVTQAEMIVTADCVNSLDKNLMESAARHPVSNNYIRLAAGEPPRKRGEKLKNEVEKTAAHD